MNPLLDIPDPPPLPSPSLLERFVLESPGPLASVLAIAGLLVLLILVQRDARVKSLRWSALLLGLAAAIVLIARFIETPREAMNRRTIELVDAVARADTPALQELLHADATLSYFQVASPVDKAEIISRVKSHFAGGQETLKDWRIQTIDSATEGSNHGTSQVRVFVQPEAFPAPNISWWQVRWTKDGDQWRVREIRPTFILGFNGDPGQPR